MIGLDTNILIRYLTQDDPQQAARAGRLIEAAESGSLFVTMIVVCEIVWVLNDVYRRSRAEIAAVLERILLTGQFAFENRELLMQALDDYRHGKGDLADYLIGRIGRSAGCELTATFDKGLKGSDLFRLM